MGVGKLSLISKLTGNNKIDSGIGEMNLSLIGTLEDYKISLDKGIGKAKINRKTMKDDNVEKVHQAQEQKIEQTAIFTKGLRSMLENLLQKGDVDTAKKMFSCNRDSALEIISQYNPAYCGTLLH